MQQVDLCSPPGMGADHRYSSITWQLWIWLALALAVAFSAALILAHPQPVRWDQVFIQSTVDADNYPALTSGIASVLLVALYKALVPHDSAGLNVHIRLLAMALYMLATFLLARRALSRVVALCVFPLLLTASLFPVLWLSTELFAGAALALSIRGLLADRAELWTAATMALLAHIKPDLVLPSLCLVTVLIWRTSSRGRRLGSMGVYAAGLLLPVIPGLVIEGTRYLRSQRAFVSFGQHYSALFLRHQFAAQGVDPLLAWQQWRKVIAATFPGATSVWQVAWRFPHKYLDFLALSVVMGMCNVLRALRWLVLFVPIATYAVRRRLVSISRADRYAALTMVGLVPMVLLSYPHVRYLARYFPLFVLTTLSFLERLWAIKAPKNTARACYLAGSAIVSVYLAHQSWSFVFLWSGLRDGQLFWFPD